MRKNHNKIVCIKLVYLPYLHIQRCVGDRRRAHSNPMMTAWVLWTGFELSASPVQVYNVDIWSILIRLRRL